MSQSSSRRGVFRVVEGLRAGALAGISAAFGRAGTERFGWADRASARPQSVARRRAGEVAPILTIRSCSTARAGFTSQRDRAVDGHYSEVHWLPTFAWMAAVAIDRRGEVATLYVRVECRVGPQRKICTSSISRWASGNEATAARAAASSVHSSSMIAPGASLRLQIERTTPSR